MCFLLLERVWRNLYIFISSLKHLVWITTNEKANSKELNMYFIVASALFIQVTFSLSLFLFFFFTMPFSRSSLREGIRSVVSRKRREAVLSCIFQLYPGRLRCFGIAWRGVLPLSRGEILWWVQLFLLLSLIVSATCCPLCRTMWYRMFQSHRS